MGSAKQDKAKPKQGAAKRTPKPGAAKSEPADPAAAVAPAASLAPAAGARLAAPESGVTVRMYRAGHGDCFLLAFPRDGGGEPVYVLIDCGYKPGSPARIHDRPQPIGEVVEHLGAATGHRLDLAVLTHEHQDHLNGLWEKNDPPFEPFAIEEAWLAWTEDPDDDFANELRLKHRDQLLTLVAARNELALAAAPDDPVLTRVDALLGLEFGQDVAGAAGLLAAAGDPANSANKQGLKLVKDKAAAGRGVLYLKPGEEPPGRDTLVVPGTGVRVYVLGPPYDADLLADEDPHDGEGFPTGHGLSFAAAVGSGGSASPFDRRYSLPPAEALAAHRTLREHYGEGAAGSTDEDRAEVPDDAVWRRIDTEWLYSAESLALKLNAGINNTSLVLAFELPATKKVLLFAADAQRGNWVSWAQHEWADGDDTVTARDLLGRTVLYKVGHHGSHNATLFGTAADDHPNLAWMATGSAAGEFAAMITAVNVWALAQTPVWNHPLPSIREELDRKARGRVFQTDTDRPAKPEAVSQAAWDQFLGRSAFADLYFDYTVRDG